jgi:hypothetical protein
MIWILVFATVAGLSIGQVLFKLGAARLNESSPGPAGVVQRADRRRHPAGSLR